MTVRFEVDGIDELKQTLKALAYYGKHPGNALDLVGQRMVAMSKRHFKKQEGPDGTPWQPLKDETVARRRAGRGVMSSYRTKGRRLGIGAARLTRIMGPVTELGLRGVKILQDTGTMYKSITYSVGINKEFVEAGVANLTEDYAPTHQFGDPKRNIPARPFMYINEKEAKQLLDLFKREILKTLEG